jgi:putative SOS response-associated peptidase YedK
MAYRTVNARVETVAEKPSFRSELRRRRCLIFADGYLEWIEKEKKKYPIYFRLKTGEPFAFAGLWETWMPKEGESVESCTVITGPPQRARREDPRSPTDHSPRRSIRRVADTGGAWPSHGP